MYLYVSTNQNINESLSTQPTQLRVTPDLLEYSAATFHLPAIALSFSPRVASSSFRSFRKASTLSFRPPTFPSLLSTPQLHSLATILHADPYSYGRIILPRHLCLPALLSLLKRLPTLLHVPWICVQHSGEESVQHQRGRGEHLRQ